MYGVDELKDIDEDMIWHHKGDFAHKNVIVKKIEDGEMVIEIDNEIIDLKHLEEDANIMMWHSKDGHQGNHNIPRKV